MTESKNLKSDELLSMMEEMQDEIESLKLEKENLLAQLEKETSEMNGKDSEAQRTISDLSSAVSMLKRKVQDQTQEIVELNGLIAKLESSDMQLSIAEKMKEQAEEELNMASTLASDTKREHEERSQELDKREADLSKKEKRIKSIENDLEGEVGCRVRNIVSKKKNELESEYYMKDLELSERVRKRLAKHEFGYISTMIYSIIVTIVAACMFKEFGSEFIAFFSSLYRNARSSIESLGMIIEGIARHAESDCGSRGAYYTVGILLSLIVIIVIFGVLILVGWFLAKNIKEYLWDEISVGVVMVVIGISVFLSPLLSELPVNLILLAIIALIIYMIVRFMCEWDWEDLKKKILFWLLWIPGAMIVIKMIASIGG